MCRFENYCDTGEILSHWSFETYLCRCVAILASTPLYKNIKTLLKKTPLTKYHLETNSCDTATQIVIYLTLTASFVCVASKIIATHMRHNSDTDLSKVTKRQKITRLPFRITLSLYIWLYCPLNHSG